ncbi:Ubiquinone/menaquinone biosynthesis C-methylase UbiE [Chitinophaga jiangningensis]|uniref:Ubiquinone/menaquinone biosynthesis C-methylase UbiE n=1 Tax=Chitinophaga jiangningensis TaxID=1419482 RepID=A0A1M7KYX1_9BACT|nr:class I SAM-dependent methyltransferase [Chitinophaga jiangningensis]SHM70246.1 Ubiquinone/menaquinone biosynthesis C-methylase UbiE [Chitinophaga jiangningensis]
MDPYKETFSTWDKIAQLYKNRFMDLDLYNDTYDRFCELVPMRHAAILELGCGPGNITRYLLAVRPDFRIVGTDISQNMIMIAQEMAPGANFQVLDSRDLHLLTPGFHGIIAGFCAPYLSATDMSKLCRDCYALLAPAGIFYCSFVAGDPAQSGFIAGSSGDRTYFYYHDMEVIQQELTANQFKILEVMYKTFHRGNAAEIHTIVIAQK